jgi:DNA-binding NarL/FixJ family response regulator
VALAGIQRNATAKDYADRIYRKLDVHSPEELVQRLRRGEPLAAAPAH